MESSLFEHIIRICMPIQKCLTKSNFQTSFKITGPYCICLCGAGVTNELTQSTKTVFYVVHNLLANAGAMTTNILLYVLRWVQVVNGLSIKTFNPQVLGPIQMKCILLYIYSISTVRHLQYRSLLVHIAISKPSYFFCDLYVYVFSSKIHGVLFSTQYRYKYVITSCGFPCAVVEISWIWPSFTQLQYWL